MNKRNGTGKYYGWKNLETWVVYFFLVRDELESWYWSELAKAELLSDEEQAVFRLAALLKTELIDDALELDDVVYTDLMKAALAKAHWLDIAKCMLKEVSKQRPQQDDLCVDSPLFSTNPRRQAEAKRAKARCGKKVLPYSRARAIARGDLVDVSETARKSRIRFPVALTRAVFKQYVKNPEGEALFDVQVIWDLLRSFAVVARHAGEQSEIVYSLYSRDCDRAATWPLMQLKALCGPGDDGKPVITIMLPDED